MSLFETVFVSVSFVGSVRNFRFNGFTSVSVSSISAVLCVVFVPKWLGVSFQKLCFFIVGLPTIRSIELVAEILALREIIFVILFSVKNSTPMSMSSRVA